MISEALQAKRTRKSTQVLDVQLASVRLATHLRRLASTCNDLRELALTLVELQFGRKCFTDFIEPTLSLFGHPSQAHAQVLVLQTCVDLRRLASPFGQGVSLPK